MLSSHNTHMMSFLQIILVSLIFIVGESSSDLCHKDDYNGLTRFKFGIRTDSHERLKSWTSLECCEWEGIVCDKTTGRVTEILLNGYIDSGPSAPDIATMGGSLSPNSLTLLTSLQVLDLGSNRNLTGQLPASIGFDLPNLRQLILSGNEFSGPIPGSIVNLSKLEVLDLAENSFSSSLPSSLGSLTSLKMLFLNSNRLTGSIPDSITNLSRLTFLYLAKNRLTGHIPEQIGGLRSMKYLDLSYNTLTGELPTSIGKLRSLVNLDLSFNKLHSALPVSLANASSTLVLLRLQKNRFVGKIPAEYLQLQKLEDLDFSDNRLEGRIPFGKPLSDFPKSSYAGNAGLCGFPLDPCRV